MTERQYADFDVARLWLAMCTKRESKGLSDRQMMDEIKLANNTGAPMGLATVKNMVRRNDTTCQHALHMLRWLDKTPEGFLVGAQADGPLPYSDRGRLYWNIRELGGAVHHEKEEQGLTWKQLAQELKCSQNQVSGLHRIRYGISIHLAMRITQWLRRPSTDFIVVI